MRGAGAGGGRVAEPGPGGGAHGGRPRGRAASRVLAIAVNTFRETVRARVLYVLVLAGALTIGAGTLLSPLALGETARITKDVGLAAIDVLGLAIIVLLGTTLVYKEIEKRTIVLLLSKPLRRHEFIAGKFLGLTLTLALAVAVESSFLEAALWLGGAGFDLRVLGAAGRGCLARVPTTARPLPYAGFAGPLVAAFRTAATFGAGRLTGDLLELAALQHAPALQVVFYVLPNLASMDVRPQVVHGLPFDAAQIGLAIAHGMSYSAGALVLAVLAFRHREFR